MKDEWWLRAAATNDTLVADILLRLKDSAPSSSPSPSTSFLLNRLPPSWGTRHPRSKPPSTSSPEKRRETRLSPTTPLSWTSGDGGCEVSSSLVPQPSHVFIPKISGPSNTLTNNAVTSKRPRRKKTFAELKEEESSLLKERIYLNMELATMRLKLKEQRSTNENLKRIKLDFQAESGIKSEASSEHDARSACGNGRSEAASSSPSQVKTEYASESSFAAERVATSQEPVFVLPDLNVSPDEEHGVAGMS